VGATVGAHPSGPGKVAELKHGIEVALGYKEGLEREVAKRRISKSAAERQFEKAYPWYGTWIKELEKFIRAGTG
jgi:hypothetical protein